MLFARKDKGKIQPLNKHLRSVHKLMLKILQVNKVEINSQIVKLVALLHDCGKGDKNWQSKFPQTSKVPHALLSLPLTYAFLKKNKIEKNVQALVLSVILSHHRPLQENIYSRMESLEVDYENEIFEILTTMNLKISKKEIKNLLKESLMRPFTFKVEKEKYLSPLDILKEKCIDLLNDPDLNFSTNKEFIEKFWKLQGALIEADFIDVGMWTDKLRFEDFYHPFQKFRIFKKPEEGYSWQKECIHDANFIFIPMPTGAGKTEAALFWARHHNPKRVFYVLPVTFAINAMFGRFKQYFENVGIYHHWADVTLQAFSPELLDNYLYFKHMLSPIQIVTPDQLILSFLHWRKWTVKLFSFLNSLFIFDEVHTYDPLLFSHFRILLDKLKNQFNAKICIITATLPNKFYELETFKDFVYLPRNWERYYKERYVGEVKYESELLRDWLIKNLGKFENEWKNKKILIVLNTVERAQKIFEEFFLHNPKAELIHGRYILKDRIEKEKSVLDKTPQILIATQIVEVSLDIDYDILLTELAPIDSLIQRMGRVNRRRKRRAEVIIFEVPDSKPYKEEIMKISHKEVHKLVGKKNDWENLKAFNKYFEEIFTEFFSSNSKNWHKAQNIWERFAERDIWAFTSPQHILYRFVRKVEILHIPVIPLCFVEELCKIKEDARKLWKKANKEADKEKRKKALKKEIEIRKFVVEVPYYILKDKEPFFHGELKHLIAEVDYNEQLGLKINKNCSKAIPEII